MFGLFRRKQSGPQKNQLEGKDDSKGLSVDQLVAVVDGNVIPIDQVKDPVFSGRMMGDGAAVIPTGTTVVAPCSGKISMIAETGHAFGMECDNGLEILVHIGIDTVSLGGKGFTVLAKPDTHVEAGIPIITFDPAVMKEAGLDMTTPIVILDDYGNEITMSYPEEAKAGVTVVMECK